MTRQAAVHELVFEEPPPPLRQVGAPPATKPTFELVSASPPAPHIAADSRRPHGSRAKYVLERCRCEPCRAANREYARRREQAMQRPDEVWVAYVPAGPARRHLRELAAAGVGLKSVAAITGLSHGGLSKLVYGDRARRMPPSKRIRPATAARILAVKLEDAAGAQKVPAGPTWVLLEDLLARGYTKTWLARALGSKAKTPALQVRPDRVRASTARAVAELHRRLEGRAPPPRRTRWST